MYCRCNGKMSAFPAALSSRNIMCCMARSEELRELDEADPIRNDTIPDRHAHSW